LINLLVKFSFDLLYPTHIIFRLLLHLIILQLGYCSLITSYILINNLLIPHIYNIPINLGGNFWMHQLGLNYYRPCFNSTYISRIKILFTLNLYNLKMCFILIQNINYFKYYYYELLFFINLVNVYLCQNPPYHHIIITTLSKYLTNHRLNNCINLIPQYSRGFLFVLIIMLRFEIMGLLLCFGYMLFDKIIFYFSL